MDFFQSFGRIFGPFPDGSCQYFRQGVYFQRYEVILQSQYMCLGVGRRTAWGCLVRRLFDGGEPPGIVHGMEVADMDGVEQLEWAAEHLLPQTGVDGEHGVVDGWIVLADVAQDGEEELFHLVVGHLYAVDVGGVGGGREVPVVAVASMEEGGAVAQRDDGAHSDIGGAVGFEVEVGRGHLFAEAQDGQRQRFVDATATDGVVGGEEVPVGGVGTPLGDVRVVVGLVEMGDDEVDGLAVGVVKLTVQQSVGVEPVVEYD